MALWLSTGTAHALPLFASQTGQNCVACHAGGQFPELTPYGRMFKMTGYTFGDRTRIPLSVMGVISGAHVADTSKSDSPSTDFQRNNKIGFDSASLFAGGRITNNLGAFIQTTYDSHAVTNTDGSFSGHTSADNMDIRLADRSVDTNRDLVLGMSLNNNPSLADPWNTSPAWVQYLPGSSLTSHQFADGSFPSLAAGHNIAGLTGYAYLNKSWYGEVGFYGTAKGPLSVFSAGIDSANKTRLSGVNPYLRLAYTREWGPHNLMVGATSMIAHVYDAGMGTGNANNVAKYRNTGVDAQYQYLLAPHTLTAQLVYMRQNQSYSANSMAGAGSPYFLSDGTTPVNEPNGSDVVKTLRTKLSYVYQAKYGGSVAFFNVSGSTNTLNQTSGYDSNGQITSTDPNGTGITSARVNGNLSGNPGTRGFTYELFWTPIQFVRTGLQYTAYNKFNGAANNYDGFGRNARDNNTLRFFLWAAY